MNIGYACKIMDNQDYTVRGCTLKKATPERLEELTAHNLDVLDRMLNYNITHEIRLFRISSDIIPFGSGPAQPIAWENLFVQRLRRIGEKALGFGMRLSMHPGQYTVINSPNPDTVAASVRDLAYHARFLDALGLGPAHKLILHIGGAYGEKESALARFAQNYRQLDEYIKRRLVIENDDRIFHIEDVLRVGRDCSIPVVFDVLHHAVNPCCDSGRTVADWVDACAATWSAEDGAPKIHYSQQAEGKKPGSHSEFIGVDDFLALYRSLEGRDLDIMLEVKDKNLSAVRCRNCVRPDRSVKILEQEWSRYKYAVLERGPELYRQIREHLKEKEQCDPAGFYRLIEQALVRTASSGQQINAAMHVWGYFRDLASEKEKMKYMDYLEALEKDKLPVRTLKRFLWKLAVQYRQEYLLQSYYFLYE